MSLSLNYPTVRPTLLLDFINTDQIDPRITFSRASSATYFNSNGILTTAATNALRRDYNPSTLAPQGFLAEEQRTNSIRNNTMQGAVAGTPGTLPTNWGVNAVSGVTVSVSGVSTENGITYVDLNYSGTAGATSNQFVAFDVIGGIAALDAQTWTHSIYIKQVTSVTLPSVSVSWRTYNSSNVLVTANGTNVTVADNSANLRTTRQTYSATLSGATIASIRPTVEIPLVSGTTYNFTLRIGLPQLELGAFATSVIPTTTTALTRSADVTFVNTLSPWYNASAGTLYAEILRQTTTGYPGRARFSDGTANNAIDLYYDAAANSSTFEIKSGGTPSVQIYGGGGALNTVVKAAAAWETNNAAVVYDGSVVGTDTSVVVPSGINQIRLANALTGYLRRITYYPVRLSNAQLQAITSA